MLMNPKTHIGNIVIQALREKDLTIAWLARQVGCDENNFYKKLRENIISKELLYRISYVLREDFFAHYSKELTEKLVNFDNNGGKNLP